MASRPALDYAITQTRLLMEAYAGMPLPFLDEVAATLRITTVERGEVVVPAFTAHPFAYVMLRGVTKLRMVTRHGSPTIRFFLEGEVAGSYNSLGHPQVATMAERGLFGPRPDPRLFPEGSPFELVAVEQSDLVAIDFRVLVDLAGRSDAWARLLMGYQSALLLALHAGLPEAHIGTPEERYRDLAERRPDLVRRLSQREIAAYIGVTEVGMSRIVKRVNTHPRAVAPSSIT